MAIVNLYRCYACGFELKKKWMSPQTCISCGGDMGWVNAVEEDE